MQPIITEKSMIDAGIGKFTFKVSASLDKTAIKHAVQTKFAVHVTGVATSLVKGKSKRVGARRTEKTLSPWKKAIVKLKKGEKIAIFDVAQ